MASAAAVPATAAPRTKSQSGEKVEELLATVQQLSGDVATNYSAFLANTQSMLKKITNSSLEHVILLEHSSKTVCASLDAAVEQAHNFVSKCIELDKELQRLDVLESQLAQAKDALNSLETMVHAL